jgi:hypothetical protein
MKHTDVEWQEDWPFLMQYDILCTQIVKTSNILIFAISSELRKVQTKKKMSRFADLWRLFSEVNVVNWYGFGTLGKFSFCVLESVHSEMIDSCSNRHHCIKVVQLTQFLNHVNEVSESL